MAENYNITGSSRPKTSQPEISKTVRERSGGPLSDRRVRIAAIVATVVVVFAAVFMVIRANNVPSMEQGRQAAIAREKALRDREDAPQDSPSQPAQTASAQSVIRETD